MVMESSLDACLNVLDQLGVQYKRESSRAKLACPFHDERTPSFYIFEGACFCFGCQRHCWHDELIAKLAGCTIIEAKKKLGTYDPNQTYIPQPKAQVDRYEFAEPAQDYSAFWEKLQNDTPQPMIDFLKSKALEKVAYDEGMWRWMPRGTFKCWEKQEGIVIPYFSPTGEVSTFRLRPYYRMQQKFGHPIAPPKIPLQASFLIHNTKEAVYFCEGETDSLSLYSLGYNVVCLPGVGAHKQLNSAIQQCMEWGAPAFIFCGDNDEAGKKFNQYAIKATLDLGMGLYTPQIRCLLLPDEYNMSKDGSFKRKDINDFFKEGRLKDILEHQDLIAGGAKPPNPPQDETLEELEKIFGKGVSWAK